MMTALPEPAGTCTGIVHVVKCGGSALRQALARLPGSYTGPWYFDADHFAEERFAVGLPEDERKRVVPDADQLSSVVDSHRMIIGHYWARMLTEAGCSSLAVQLREPRSRLLSLHRYWASQVHAPEELGPWGSEVVAHAHRSLKDFLRTDLVRPAVDNVIARQLLTGMAGGRSARLGWQPRQADLEALLDRLVVADWSEASNRFVARLCELLDEPDVPASEPVNVTEVRAEPERIDPETRALLDRHTSLDSSLIEELGRAGILPRRSRDDLEREFRETAEHHSYVLG